MLRGFAAAAEFQGRLHQIASGFGYDTPDFAAVGQSYTIASETVSNPTELPAAVARMWANPTEPYLLNVIIPTEGYCAPKVLSTK